MTNIINTGRPMTAALQRALDSVTRQDRRVTVAALRGSQGRLAALHHALATELELCGLRELETDIEFRRMTQDPIPDPRPLPEATGPALRFDPETGEFFEIGDDSDEGRLQ